MLEDQSRSRGPFYGSPATVEGVRAAARRLSGALDEAGSAVVQPSELPFSSEAKSVFESALRESRRMDTRYIAPEHILVALLSMGNIRARQVLVEVRVDPEAIKAEALRRITESLESAQAAAAAQGMAAGQAQAQGKGRGAGGKAGGKPKALEEFCTDLCQQARENKVDPVIGRESEIARVVQILGRRQKNNPILLGEPGVGKTAIAEGLARLIVQGIATDGEPLPEFLRSKRVLRLDIGLVMAGAKERGELESRMTRILKEAKEAKDVIFVIDEIHTVVGAGSVSKGGGGGGLDIANLLKPALARGEFQVIGATTLDEHRKASARAMA